MASTSNESTQSHDAIDLLTSDHEKVKGLFENYSALSAGGATTEAKQDLVEEIVTKLEAHERLENEVFFPAVRNVLKKDDVLGVAAEEQMDAGEVISELGRLEPGDKDYDAKVLAYGEHIREHAEEEEKAVFPQVKASSVDTESLGATMLAHEKAAG